MKEEAAETWSQIKETYWDRDWDTDEMLADNEQSNDQSPAPADD